MYYHNPVTVQKKDIVKLLQKTPALHILLKMGHRPKKTTPETPLGTPLRAQVQKLHTFKREPTSKVSYIFLVKLRAIVVLCAWVEWTNRLQSMYIWSGRPAWWISIRAFIWVFKAHKCLERVQYRLGNVPRRRERSAGLLRSNGEGVVDTCTDATGQSIETCG